jgi:hypothetical protein
MGPDLMKTRILPKRTRPERLCPIGEPAIAQNGPKFPKNLEWSVARASSHTPSAVVPCPEDFLFLPNSLPFGFRYAGVIALKVHGL